MRRGSADDNADADQRRDRLDLSLFGGAIAPDLLPAPRSRGPPQIHVRLSTPPRAATRRSPPSPKTNSGPPRAAIFAPTAIIRPQRMKRAWPRDRRDVGLDANGQPPATTVQLCPAAATQPKFARISLKVYKETCFEVASHLPARCCYSPVGHSAARLGRRRGRHRRRRCRPRSPPQRAAPPCSRRVNGWPGRRALRASRVGTCTGFRTEARASASTAPI
jgi:hypothetical protein